MNSFQELNLSKEVQDALAVLHYERPTEIQTAVLPPAMAGQDIVGTSQTGSGKTAAFAIPLCEFARWEENVPESLILEPTRELTVQVKEEVFHIGRNKRLKVVDLFGGFPIEKQMLSLKQKTHIAVGTPGRVLDHVRRGTLDLSRLCRIVIDEADLMLDMGFMEEVSLILRELKPQAQRMLFSATIGSSLQEMIETYMKDPVRIEIGDKNHIVETIDQSAYFVDAEEKYDLFRTLLTRTNPDKALIFCGTKQMVDVLVQKLKRDRIRCGTIHGDMEQRDRIHTIEDFRLGKIRYLIATDVAARGIDIDSLTHVFNYDFPTGKETYVHRIGRTGRNGQAGCAISLVCEMDLQMKQQVEAYIGREIPAGDLEALGDASQAFWNRQKERVHLKPQKGAGFARTITRLSIGGGKKSKLRTGDIVATICSIDGLTAEDIGIIDIRDSLTYVEILNQKGDQVLEALQEKTIKGKHRKVRVTKSR